MSYRTNIIWRKYWLVNLWCVLIFAAHRVNVTWRRRRAHNIKQMTWIIRMTPRTSFHLYFFVRSKEWTFGRSKERAEPNNCRRESSIFVVYLCFVRLFNSPRIKIAIFSKFNGYFLIDSISSANGFIEVCKGRNMLLKLSAQLSSNSFGESVFNFSLHRGKVRKVVAIMRIISDLWFFLYS